MKVLQLSSSLVVLACAVFTGSHAQDTLTSSGQEPQAQNLRRRLATVRETNPVWNGLPVNYCAGCEVDGNRRCKPGTLYDCGEPPAFLFCKLKFGTSYTLKAFSNGQPASGDTMTMGSGVMSSLNGQTTFEWIECTST